MEASALKGDFYSLRWTNHQGNLCESLANYEAFEKLADVTLVCDGQFIRVHKLVLSAFSGFFQDMFKGGYGNVGVNGLYGTIIQPYIIMHGVKFQHLKHIVDFIYQGEIRVLDSDLEEVLALGNTLQIKGLCSVKLRPKGTQTATVSNTTVLPNSGKLPIKTKTPALKSAVGRVPMLSNSTDNTKILQPNQKPETNTILPHTTEELTANVVACTIKLASKSTSVFMTDPTKILQQKSEIDTTSASLNQKFSQDNETTKTQQESNVQLEKESLIKRRPITNPSVSYEKKQDDNLISRVVHISENIFEPPTKKVKNSSPDIEIAAPQMHTDAIKHSNEDEMIQPAKDNNCISNSEKVDKKDTSDTLNDRKGIAENTSLNKDNNLKLRIKQVSKRTKKESEKKGDNIPRPPNAFMIFANEWRKKLSVEHPEENNKDISVRLGSLWKSLTHETKDTYYTAAAKAQEEHQVKYQLDASQFQSLKKKKIKNIAMFGPNQKCASLSDIVEVSDNGSSDVIECDLDDSSRDTVFSSFSSKSN